MLHARVPCNAARTWARLQPARRASAAWLNRCVAASVARFVANNCRTLAMPSDLYRATSRNLTSARVTQPCSERRAPGEDLDATSAGERSVGRAAGCIALPPSRRTLD
jgi:hypothetical protein